ncbi:MAG TPA: carbamate kinase [Thermoanaerobaculia bacterium]|nr:carbamate kinase [Thermoanaerobaculia bacterium]
MRVVMALGGNALLRRGESLDVEVQRANVRVAARAIAEVARRHTVIVTHGNGPQVGLLALQSEAFADVRAYPLDVLGAESEGMIGYLLAQELKNELPEREIAVLLTQVRVDVDDPAFARPDKPIGPLYEDEEQARSAATRGVQVARDGEGWRRVVASPLPREVLELATIELLVDAGRLVVCAGGGGIPVVRGTDGALRGVEAVIDKDRSACRLGLDLGADLLLLLTDVAAVYRDWPGCAEPLRRVAPEDLRALTLAAGSMAPKVDAACRFVEGGGARAAIGALQDAPALVRGERGTQVELGAPARW